MIAIDPGTTQTAICNYVPSGPWIHGEIMPNEKVLEFLKSALVQEHKDPLAIEMIASYGMPVGSEIFDTCVWIGRFIAAWNRPYRLIYRRDVKLHICHSMKANDASIRQALIDRFGPPGTKKSPGLTYGLKKDMWSALAVAVTASETRAKM